ncbi:MAG: hypothetical protein DRG82_01795 [Deltaproteobacteria bacterium]|nr:MAG: hypothetical protein B1H13_04340 [Desulfobacteraceae bacterium 4484_190.3]RLB19252.1 MAG: hypothetical protein DRG82_01795 [Deltaproteobacteria bacterium]
MESYLIRIYRRDPKHPEAIAGTVGKVGAEETRAFMNLNELGKIIIGKKKQEGEKDAYQKKAKD